MPIRCDTDILQNDQQASEYYDDRYTTDYMCDWPKEKRRRVKQAILTLGLGPTGVAVDLGCGTGVFSEVLQQALPGWRIIGLEISPNAIATAKANHPDIDFRLLPEADILGIQADFVFSHHVLEHVLELDQTWQQIQMMCKAGARVMHFLPCGDAHSFEHRLARLTRGGIDKETGNRFFYEDPGHVRRLTWQGLCDSAAPMGFVPDQVRYANRFWGGLSWISKTAPDKAVEMAQPRQAIHRTGQMELTIWRVVFRLLATMNRWAAIWDWRQSNAHGLRGKLRLAIGTPTGMIGKTTCRVIDHLAHREWSKAKATTGSEMAAMVRLALPT